MNKEGLDGYNEEINLDFYDYYTDDMSQEQLGAFTDTSTLGDTIESLRNNKDISLEQFQIETLTVIEQI